MSGRIILTSRGLNTEIGRNVIKKCLGEDIKTADAILVITMARYGISDMLRDACIEIGFSNANIFVYDGEREFDIKRIFQYVYISEVKIFMM